MNLGQQAEIEPAVNTQASDIWQMGALVLRVKSHQVVTYETQFSFEFFW